MNTQEILSIVAISLLGLCLLCGLAKMAMKGDSAKKNCDKACSMAVFAAVALVGVSQLLTETEKYGGSNSSCTCSGPGMCPGQVSGQSCNQNSDCNFHGSSQDGCYCVNSEGEQCR
jgi:hypothetical protein